MGIFSFFRGIITNFYVTFKEASTEAKRTTGFTACKLDYITDSGVWELMGYFTKDRRYFKPKGIDRLIRVTKIYPYNGTSQKIYVYDKNCDSVELGRIPQRLPKNYQQSIKKKRIALDKLIKETKDPELRQMAIDSTSFADYEIPGASVLASYAFDLVEYVDMRFIQGVNRGRMLLMLIISFLIGGTIFSFVTALLLLSLASGSG